MSPAEMISPTSTLRFLVVTSRPSAHALAIAERLQRLGHDVALVTPELEEARDRGLRALEAHEVAPGEAGVIVACDGAALLAAADCDPGAVRIMLAADELPPQVAGAAQAVLVADERTRRRVAALAVPTRVEVVGADEAERIVAIASDLGAAPELPGPLAELARLMRLVHAAEERAGRADKALREHRSETEDLAALHAAVRAAKEAESAVHVEAARQIATFEEAARSADENALAAFARVKAGEARIEDLERTLEEERRTSAALREQLAAANERPLAKLRRTRGR